ncbi:MAG: chromate efflux transporter [Rhodobacteraceae bacterium]|nr:chromate efflux transporter [Paracoccaceae bacterium]
MSPSYRELFSAFGRIGCLSFGGPAAQIALMEEELVSRRGWLSQEAFLRALSFCMLLPGPEAMQLATYAGWRLKGVWGGILAGSLFVVPGAIIIFALAALYIEFGAAPIVQDLFLGIQATVIVIVLTALRKIAGKLEGNVGLAIAGVAFVAIFFVGVPFPLIILGAGLFGWFRAKGVSKVPPQRAPRPGLLAAIAGLWGLPIVIFWAAGATFLLSLVLFFSQLAVVTFGGAYSVLAYMTQTVVQDFGWISADAMIDALGLAETTPGPLILVTQFVGVIAGHAQGGWPLAFLAGLVTLWVTFLPCFLWIFAGAPYLERLTSHPRIAAALRAVTAAVVGVILSLSLFFAMHVFFGEVEPGNGNYVLPVLETFRPVAVLLTGIAGVLMLGFGRGVLTTLAVMIPITLMVAMLA